MTDVYLKLFAAATVCVAVSVLFKILLKYSKMKKMPYWAVQSIIGVAFGALAVFGTEFGVDVRGAATANVRDMAPLCAGLIFGGPAGIIAGLIGGAERWLATMWGAGAYSQVACSLSTVLAGFIAAFLRKKMYDDECPTASIGMATAIVVEVLHLTILFLTHLSDAEEAYEVVRMTTLPMIVVNGVGMFASVLAANFFEYGKRKKEKKAPTISQKIQVHLLATVIVAYIVTTMFVFALQTGTAVKDADRMMKVALEDCIDDIQASPDRGVEDDTAIALKTVELHHIGSTGYILLAGTNQELYGERYSNRNLTEVLTDVVLKTFSQTKEMELFMATVNGEKCFCEYRYLDDLTLMAVLPQSEGYATRDAAIYVNSFMEVLVFALFFMFIFFMIRRIVVNGITSVNASLREIIGGDLSKRVDVKGTLEMENLSRDINSTVNTLNSYIDEANTRLDKELLLAKNIQSSALPSVFPPFPNRKDFDVYAMMDPAKEVGGDFYDFYLLGESRLAFLAADVSGKGIPASLFMMRAKTLIKSLAESGLSVDEIFRHANVSLCEGNDADMFVTAWMGVLDLISGHLTFANAGHNPPLIRRANGEFEYLRMKPCFVLAGFDDTEYCKMETDLKPGDRIFLYTDGVTETMNEEQQIYGEERLKMLAQENADRPGKVFAEQIRKELSGFAGEAVQADDITMLIMDYFGQGSEGSSLEYGIFDASISLLDEVQAFAREHLAKMGLEADGALMMQIELALEEIFVNVAHYAYPDGVGPVTVGVGVEGDTVTLEFRDSGKPFNPLETSEPDVVKNGEDDDSVGGLGIFMVRKMMDEMSYEYSGGENILTMKKIRK